MFLFRIGIFLTIVPFVEYLRRKEQRVTARQALNQRKIHLHVNFSVEQFIKGLFTLGMPYWHFQVFIKERTHHLIEDQKQMIPFTICNIKKVV